RLRCRTSRRQALQSVKMRQTARMGITATNRDMVRNSFAQEAKGGAAHAAAPLAGGQGGRHGLTDGRSHLRGNIRYEAGLSNHRESRPFARWIPHRQDDDNAFIVVDLEIDDERRDDQNGSPASRDSPWVEGLVWRSASTPLTAWLRAAVSS